MTKIHDDYTVAEGITDKQLTQLLEHTGRDEAVRRHTRDAKRFADLESAEKWKKTASAIYTMADAEGNLLGLIWFQRMAMPEAKYFEEVDRSLYQDTFAIRIYSHARGKKLSGKFMDYAFGHYPTRLVWLVTSHDNHAAVRSYVRHGFITVSAPDEAGKIVMILPA